MRLYEECGLKIIDHEVKLPPENRLEDSHILKSTHTLFNKKRKQNATKKSITAHNISKNERKSCLMSTHLANNWQRKTWFLIIVNKIIEITYFIFSSWPNNLPSIKLESLKKSYILLSDPTRQRQLSWAAIPIQSYKLCSDKVNYLKHKFNSSFGSKPINRENVIGTLSVIENCFCKSVLFRSIVQIFVLNCVKIYFRITRFGSDIVQIYKIVSVPYNLQFHNSICSVFSKYVENYYSAKNIVRIDFNTFSYRERREIVESSDYRYLQYHSIGNARYSSNSIQDTIKSDHDLTLRNCKHSCYLYSYSTSSHIHSNQRIPSDSIDILFLRKPSIEPIIHNSEQEINIQRWKKTNQSKFCSQEVINQRSRSENYSVQKILRTISRIYINVFIIFLVTCVPIISASLHNIKYSTNVVKTKYGPLRGIIVRSNPPVEAFLGVPYATPPVGSLRYMPPVTPSTWRNTKLADRFAPVCPQRVPMPPNGALALLDEPRERLAQLRRFHPLLANQSEDCLYLNLYVPKFGDAGVPDENHPMATIVYIHGESYEWNSGNLYDGSVLAAHGNVIVVTINFRLGVLGFLKTGAKGSAQGNFGLMDLVAGLHWLRENLPAFNGQPNKVTLMGHGTGAALANILIVSPVASDLVNRAIILSGSALSPWAIQKDPLFVKRRVAEHTGCHGDLLEEDLAPCLRTKPVAELLSVTLDTPRFLPGFAPFVDGTVIINPATAVTSPLTLPAGSAITSTMGIELADFPSRELLFGLTTIESYLDLSAQDLEFGFNETRRDRILRTYVRNVYHYHLNEIYSALKNEYTDWERPPRNPVGSRDAALELLSDGHTAAPLVRLGYLHSLRGGRSYFLHFRHQSGERDFPQRLGSVRGEDVPFCLGLPLSPLFPYNYTKQDIKISRILVRYLANFAKSGNPNEPSPTSSLDISHSNDHSHTVNSDESRKSSISSNSDKQLLSLKQKRHVVNNRNKRSNINNVEDVNGAPESEEESGSDDVDEHGSSEQRETDKRDRLDDITNLHVPFWDTYDAINQLYLELGSKVEIRNHYRGHKLSMWLSLIPQLHSPGESAELSMRHHHFLEESSQYYDGIVRTQSLQRPPPVKVTILVTTPTTTPKTGTTAATISPPTTTDCPPNATIVPTIAATRPQHNQAMNSINNNSNNNNNNNLLRRLANSQYQSYTTALTVTIAVGCFLLLLNVLIFAGIYYQREKRANDAKKKEELTEAENRCSSSPNSEKCGKGSRKSSLQSVSGYQASGSFGEYSCYDEKLQCQEKRALADICSVELPLQEFKHSPPSSSTTSSIRRSITSESYKHVLFNSSHDNLILLPPTYSSPSQSTDNGGCSSNGVVTYRQIATSTEQCNQATQSDDPIRQDVGTTISEADMNGDDDFMGPGLPAPPPPPRSAAPFQGIGILRQQGGSATPGSAKKRVQIQEISV